MEAVRRGDLEPYGHLACQRMPKRSMRKVLPCAKLQKSGTFCSEEASADSTETFSSTHCAHGPAKVWWDSHEAKLLMFMRALTIHATFSFSSCFLSRPKKTDTTPPTGTRSTPAGPANQERKLTPEIAMHSKAARNLLQPNAMHLTMN